MNNSKVNIEGFGIQDETVNQNNQYNNSMKKGKVKIKQRKKQNPYQYTIKETVNF